MDQHSPPTTPIFRRHALVDADSEVGGCLGWITKLPGRQEWRHVIEYRELQLSKLKNVTTILNTRMTADDVLEYGAELVVVATGSHYSVDAVSPYDRRPLPLAGFTGTVLSPEDAMTETSTPGRRVLLWDTDGYFVGPGVAEHLARLGHEVVVATPSSSFGSYLGYTMEQSRTTSDLRGLGVRIFTSSSLGEVTGEEIRIETLSGPVDLAVDSVVVVGQRQADGQLFRELQNRRGDWDEAGLVDVFQVGDSVRPSFIADAIFSGHRLAREIDSPDPDEPLPYIRERRLLDATEVDFTFDGPALSRET